MYDDQNRTDFFTLNQSLTQWLNIELGYDSLDRLSGRIVNLNGFSYTEQFAYESVTGTGTSSFVSMHTVNGVEYNYVYDTVGNITAVYKDLVRVASYSYDKLGQLTMAFLTADDGTQDVYEYYYDKSGNITNALHHRGDTTQESQYTYGNATWGDLLTKYNGVNISYDAIGNPINWRNAGSLMWQGRRLTRFSHVNGEQYAYTYNADGIRTSKQIRNADNALITGVEYIYDGSKLVAESRNGEWMYYVYDETGAIAGVSYNGVLYLFRKNLQGDVTGIYNANGALVVEYTYSPYGEVLSVTGTMANTIGTINPIRYRGYYYDAETGFYYVLSRYYDPIVGRFLNSDGIIGANGGVIGYNLFAYCNNNSINYSDHTGFAYMYYGQGYSPNDDELQQIIDADLDPYWYAFDDCWGKKTRGVPEGYKAYIYADEKAFNDGKTHGNITTYYFKKVDARKKVKELDIAVGVVKMASNFLLNLTAIPMSFTTLKVDLALTTASFVQWYLEYKADLLLDEMFKYKDKEERYVLDYAITEHYIVGVKFDEWAIHF